MGALEAKPRRGRDRETSAMIKYLFLLALFGAVFCEPEPEAAPVSNSDPTSDPWYYYSGYGYPSYGYGYVHYGGYYGHRYYGLWGRKKREAEPEPNAEPDPKADPYYYYSYGYPAYWYGHYGGDYGHRYYGLWGRK